MAREELEITYSLPSVTTRGDIIKLQERQIHSLNSTLLESCERINDLSKELNDIKSAILSSDILKVFLNVINKSGAKLFTIACTIYPTKHAKIVVLYVGFISLFFITAYLLMEFLN